ncbi:2OG-Fe(II) oxygenase [Filomicrobium sp.]|uniref:2OG-Fe(II) oxygenase n=1 Tax=Filomicrobium sp. TaxID=2024831 RepID=UPI002582DB72|nr:2OG-Fe(II) oxygenase [Filomicrobium sp.]MCV0371450.1 2OG-Fe(II) oxygenase [Filomicrobium sp.]
MLLPIEVANVFSPDECKKIISTTDEKAYADARLIDGARQDNTRRARITWLDDTDKDEWVFRRLLDTVSEANRHHFKFGLEEFSERMQVAYYGAETEAFFDWHIDIGDGQFARHRKLTIVTQLSEDDSYTGGDLETNADGNVRRASRACGTAMLLPSFVLHRVTPVTHNARYSLTLWAHGPEFR